MLDACNQIKSFHAKLQLLAKQVTLDLFLEENENVQIIAETKDAIIQHLEQLDNGLAQYFPEEELEWI